MKRLLVLTVLFALAAPAAYAAPPSDKGKPDTTGSSSDSGQGPAALCKEQLKTMGAQNFQSTYAPTGKGKNAFGKCVSSQSQKSEDNEQNAAKQCKAERAKDADAFAKSWGTNANKRNAFGKCVSAKTKEQDEQEQQETLNAAKQCKAERAKDADAFAKNWGTNANKRNAFGKCVSAKAKTDSAKDDDDSND